jgi:polysaccharide biosynthesis transport protein
LMVVGVAKTSQSLLKKALARMNAYHLHCLGVVANHLRAK